MGPLVIPSDLFADAVPAAMLIAIAAISAASASLIELIICSFVKFTTVRRTMGPPTGGPIDYGKNVLE